MGLAVGSSSPQPLRASLAPSDAVPAAAAVAVPTMPTIAVTAAFVDDAESMTSSSPSSPFKPDTPTSTAAPPPFDESGDASELSSATRPAWEEEAIALDLTSPEAPAPDVSQGDDSSLSSAPLFASAALSNALGSSFPPGSELAAILAEEAAILAEEAQEEEREREAERESLITAARRKSAASIAAHAMELSQSEAADAANTIDIDAMSESTHDIVKPGGVYEDVDEGVPLAALELQPEVAMVYLQQLLTLGLVRVALPEIEGGEAANPIHGDTLQVSLESFLYLETELERNAPAGAPPIKLHAGHCMLRAAAHE